MFKRTLSAMLITVAIGALVAPANADVQGSHSGWICLATDGDKQQHVDYESSGGANGYIENESTSVSFYAGCSLVNVDNATILNRFRVRVHDGNNQWDEKVECAVYRSKINGGGSVSYLDVDTTDTHRGVHGNYWHGSDTLHMELYDSADTDHPNYYYYGKCRLPYDDEATSKVYMWQAHSNTTCPTAWTNCY